MYSLKAVLNFALFFLRIVSWVANSWKFVYQHRRYFFESNIVWHLLHEYDDYCLINTVYAGIYMKIFPDFRWWSSLMTVYTGMEKAESLDWINRLLHDVLGCAKTIILTIFFSKWNTSHCKKSYPPELFHIL